MASELLWWAYLHTNGKVLVKRYWDNSYRQDCDESSLVECYTHTPFRADNYEQAHKIAEDKLLVEVS